MAEKIVSDPTNFLRDQHDHLPPGRLDWMPMIRARGDIVYPIFQQAA